MKKKLFFLINSLLLISLSLFAQPRVDSVKFFTDQDIVDITLKTDIKELRDQENVEKYQPASITMVFSDKTTYAEEIQLHARGKSRRELCNIPPIMLEFHNTTSPLLYQLSRLKLVVGCGPSSQDEQLVLKEFLLYKIYQLFEEKSFNVRLVRVNYNDSKGKMKPYTQFAFMLEDVDDMAKRNGCKASKKISFQISEMVPEIMSIVDIFEYMIGNTDWSVPGNHNIKMIYPRDDETAKVVPVPYDFDNSGFVNAYYSVPNEILGITAVTQRVYRGLSRPMSELQRTLDVFRAKKESMYSLINNFEHLNDKSKKEIINYLNDFYKIIDNENSVKSIFIERTRDK